MIIIIEEITNQISISSGSIIESICRGGKMQKTHIDNPGLRMRDQGYEMRAFMEMAGHVKQFMPSGINRRLRQVQVSSFIKHQQRRKCAYQNNFWTRNTKKRYVLGLQHSLFDRCQVVLLFLVVLLLEEEYKTEDCCYGQGD